MPRLEDPAGTFELAQGAAKKPAPSALACAYGAGVSGNAPTSMMARAGAPASFV